MENESLVLSGLWGLRPVVPAAEMQHFTFATRKVSCCTALVASSSVLGNSANTRQSFAPSAQVCAGL
eukprot:s3289_g8.t1